MFPPEKQTSIGLIVGLGAAASAALAAFYVLYKKDDDTFELDPRLKLTSSSDHAIRSTTIHKTIPKKIAGAVIGRGGEVIRRVQADTNTKIKTCDQPDGTRIMSITGSPSGVLEADEAIDAIIESFLSNVKRKIYIDANEVGLVIGKGGANIRLISEESGARVNIPRNVVNASGRVPVEVRGEVTMVEKAIAMIDEKLRSKVIKDWSSEPIRTSYPFIPSHYNVYTLTTLLMFEKFEPDVDNDFVDTFVSSVQNPSKFYLQICVPNGNDLDRFMVEMTDYYEEAENRSRAKLTSIVEGDIVAAKFMDDEHYYRVKIVSIEDTPNITDETEISVFNLDFGNEAIVKKRDLFILHEDFLFRLPFQAVECSLSGVSPISDSGWSEGAIDHFKKISRATLWEKILARPVQATDVDKERRQKFTVELILHQDGISLNIAQDLIEKGFAIALTS